MGVDVGQAGDDRDRDFSFSGIDDRLSHSPGKISLQHSSECNEMTVSGVIKLKFSSYVIQVSVV